MENRSDDPAVRLGMKDVVVEHLSGPKEVVVGVNCKVEYQLLASEFPDGHPYGVESVQVVSSDPGTLRVQADNPPAEGTVASGWLVGVKVGNGVLVTAKSKHCDGIVRQVCESVNVVDFVQKDLKLKFGEMLPV